MPQMPASMSGGKFRRRKGSKSAAGKHDKRYRRGSRQQLQDAINMYGPEDGQYRNTGKFLVLTMS